MPAVQTATRVTAHADRTAATAREGAQLCMGILEEAVQANASPLARETAKRCAEQALHSIEAAALVEQHSRSLRELLARLLGAGEPQHMQSPGPRLVPGGAPAFHGALFSHWQPTAPPAAEGGTAEPNPRSANRWWQNTPATELPDSELLTAALSDEAASSDQLVSLEDGLRAASWLEQHLEATTRRCMAAAQDLDAERSRELSTIVDWRHSLALAEAVAEESILADAEMLRLAKLQGACALPPDLRRVTQRHGQSLAAALRLAPSQLPNRQATPLTRQAAPPKAFPGPFGQPRLPAAKEGDWMVACGQLGWTSATSSNEALDLVTIAGRLEVWAKSTAESLAPAEELLDPLDENWSTAAVSLRQLHVLSMRSRSSKGQSKKTAATGVQDDGGGTQAVSQTPADDTPDEAQVKSFLQSFFGDWDRKPIDQEPKTVPTTALPGLPWGSQEAPITVSINAPPGIPGLSPPGLQAVPAGGTSTSSESAIGADPSRRGGRFWPRPTTGASTTSSPPAQPCTASVPAGLSLGALGYGVPLCHGGHSAPLSQSQPASASASLSVGMGVPASPVHRLVEPPQLLRMALSQQGPDEDETDEVDILRRLVGEAEERLPRRLLQSGEADDDHLAQWPPYSYLAGRLLQQRLPRTFHDSMGHLAQERREAYGRLPGSHLGPWANSAAAAARAHTLFSQRARTFNEGVYGDAASPILTPAGTFIATPTWSDSGEYAPQTREDFSSPLYVQASPERWVAGEL